MKFLLFFLMFNSLSAMACDVRELRQEVLDQYQKGTSMVDILGEQKGKTTVKDIEVSDSLMSIHGENFFMSKLVFNILWANGLKEEREILMAAVVDLGTCKLEEYEGGEILGSTLSSH